MGSLGRQVARQLADDLNYRMVWRELINQAARRSGVPEMALAAIDELGLLDLCPSPEACEAYRQSVKQVMEELRAQGDVVIVGRAGQVILRNYPDVLHVRLIAPRPLRAERIAQRQSIPLDCALAQVKASDRYRKKYLRRFYDVKWGNPELYHLIINTGKVSTSSAAKLNENILADPRPLHSRPDNNNLHDDIAQAQPKVSHRPITSSS
jgi:cytidylate kinase